MDALETKIRRSLEEGMGVAMAKDFPPPPVGPIEELDRAIEAVASAERSVDQLALRLVGPCSTGLVCATKVGVSGDDSLASRIRETSWRLQDLAAQIVANTEHVHRRLDGRS